MQALHSTLKIPRHGAGNALRQGAQGFRLNADNISSSGIHVPIISAGNTKAMKMALPLTEIDQ
jgi:hypothetical protein